MRKLLVALLITLVMGMVFAASENNSGYVVKAQVPNPVKIMPLGDSITEGWNGTEGVGGYRTSLYSDLVNNGFHVDFVGSQKNGTGLDNDNEGHVAYSTAEIMDDVTGWLMSNPADVVLLHIGTNDIQTTQNVSLIVTKVEGILDNIDQWGSNNGRNVTVVIARIILRSDSVSWNTTTKSYNDALQAMVSTRIANGHRLIMVDMEHALTYPTDLIIADGVHPTPIGYEKMATVWYNALTSLLSYSLTVNSAHGLVTKLPDQILYPYGTTVNLSVSAADGWTFYAWSGDLTSSNNPETIIMNANKTVTATFTQNQYQLTMVTNFGFE